MPYSVILRVGTCSLASDFCWFVFCCCNFAIFLLITLNQAVAVLHVRLKLDNNYVTCIFVLMGYGLSVVCSSFVLKLCWGTPVINHLRINNLTMCVVSVLLMTRLQRVVAVQWLTANICRNTTATACFNHQKTTCRITTTKRLISVTVVLTTTWIIGEQTTQWERTIHPIYYWLPNFPLLISQPVLQLID